MDEDAMWFEVAEEAREEMLIAGRINKCHQSQGYRSWILEEGARVCLTQVRAASIIRFSNVLCNIAQSASACSDMAGDFVELQRSEYRHQANSHEQNNSKRLKYDQMVAIMEAVITVPQLSSATVLRRT